MENKKSDNFSPIKERLYRYIDNKKIKKEMFFKDLSISAKNFHGKSARSELGGGKIAEILSKKPDLNPEWLLTGKGPMLRPVEAGEKSKPVSEDFQEVQIRFQDSKPDIHGASESIAMKDELIRIKNEQINDLKTYINRIISEKEEQLKIKDELLSLYKERIKEFKSKETVKNIKKSASG